MKNGIKNKNNDNYIKYESDVHTIPCRRDKIIYVALKDQSKTY